MSEAAKETLQQWCRDNKISQATLSEDGTTLSLGDTTLSGTDTVSVSGSDGKTVDYSVASIFLQIVDPNQGLVKYRQVCKTHQVGDPVKALDKKVVIGFFLPDAAEAAAAPTDAAAASSSKKEADTGAAAASAATSSSAPQEKKRPSSSSKHHDKHRSSSSSKDHKKRPSSSSKDKHHHHEKKKRRSLVTNEELFSNLKGVVDKRAGVGGTPSTTQQQATDEYESTLQQQEQNQQHKQVMDKEYEAAIRKALSPEGFQVTPEMLEQHRETTQNLILAHEIPVGDSASVLRAASVGTDLTRVLNLFLESMHSSSKSSQYKRSGGGATTSGAGTAGGVSPTKKTVRSYLLGKKPIILLPKGMTCPVTILNGFDFFKNARFIPRDVMMKNKNLQQNCKKTLFTRKVANAGLVEYELLDNPRKLVSKEDWDRVVAVVVLGHKWQFKDWPGKFSDPVHLFSRSFGFYIGMEGEKAPSDLEGWACQRGKLHRDKRGLDSVTHASFWNSLDEWMRIHRPELLPQNIE